MKQETFINYKSWKWFWITAAIVLIATVWYLIDEPLMPKSGSTLYGYTIGILSGVIMIYLFWYGSRKRRYFAKVTTLREVLSAHIWLGLGLALLVPLHSGFRFHLNVHTMTYLVCMLTIITGVWGMYFYRTLPPEVKSNRGEGSLKNLIEQFDNLALSLRGMETGKSDSFISFINHFDNYHVPTLPELLFGKRAKPLLKSDVALKLRTISDSERADALSAVSIIDKRQEFLTRIEKEALVQCWLKIWLILHVPLACGAMLLLIIHIISVLYFGYPS